MSNKTPLRGVSDDHKNGLLDKRYSLLAQGVPMEGLCLQLRPQLYRPADRLVRWETVVKHLNGKDHTTSVKNESNQAIAWLITLRSQLHTKPSHRHSLS
ncbi:hypothetical protein Y032_0056g2692 [Ancylostoma ceylanicum]|uniref:Uncharacterized protein n=1 Tax=Ancylostoma ceylanicum TaxID=53326 RepID=A0A016U6V5_9BILA|nr:hypothetical protein Y032_0056g2692 [Ancylostoma ceylanicum]